MKKLLLLPFLAICSLHAISQDSSKPKSKWNFLVEPYLMFPSMDGTTGLGTLPEVRVDANASDIFSHLQMGAMLNLEANNDKWAIISDITYMKLKEDAEGGIFIKSGTVEAKQLAWELTGLYRLNPWLELGLATMVNSIKTSHDLELNIAGSDPHRSSENSETWIDPMLVGRIKSNPAQKFIYSFRGEIGGFGIGSDFAWQVQAYGGYRFSKLFQLTGGFRLISINYDKGSGENRFLYNIDTFGPVVRLGFNF